MNETDIRNYAELMQEMGLTGLEITEDNKKVRLERMPAASFAEQVLGGGMLQGNIPQGSGNSREGSILRKQGEGESAGAIDQSHRAVRSPLVGIFYAAPAENAAPYVSVLCLIEAMKLMNEIVAEEDGVIAQVCVTNGQVVEYGTELFQIKRAGR